MSLTDEERKIIVNLELAKAKTTLSQVESLKQLEYWDMVANRLYYATFHAACALLIKDKHSVSTHKGVVALLGQYYIVTGKLTKEDGKLYSQLQTIREKSDYNCSFTATREDIEPLINKTSELITRISVLIND